MICKFLRFTLLYYSAAVVKAGGIRRLAPPSCGDGKRQGSEECDGSDAVDCPGLCQSDCSCFVSTVPMLEFFSNTVIRDTIPSTLFGTNTVYSYESDSFWNGTIGQPASESLFYTANAFLRYPGGEVTSNYHWDNPVGRGWADSWAPGFNGVYEDEENWMSLDEYFTRLGKSKPMLGVNMASGWKYDREQDGLDEAAALAEYVKNKTDSGVWPEVTYWFLDNEQHLEKFNKAGEPSPWTEEMYASHINNYAAVMKNLFPNAKFIANWKNGASPGWGPLIAGAGSNIDVMDFHNYWHKNGWATTDWQSYLDGIDDVIRLPSGSTYREYVQSFKDVGGPDRETAMLEWGLSPPPTEGIFPSRFQSAFIVADIFMQLIDSGLDHSCYWPLRVTPGSIHSHRALLDDNNQPTVVRLFLQFFNAVKRYDLVQTTIGAGNTGTIAAKSKSGNIMVVYILRRSINSLEIRIADSSGIFAPTTATAVSYSAPNGDTNTTYADRSSPLTQVSDSGETTLTVPGWSLTKVILENTAPPPSPPAPTQSPSTQAPSVSSACHSNGTPCNHRGSCNPTTDTCCSDCCSGSGGNPKQCIDLFV